MAWGEFSSPRPLSLSSTLPLDSLIGRYEGDSVKARYLAEARRSLVDTLYADERDTLTALRLAAGFSQAKLASLAATTQPYIARIENGQADPSTEMVARIAAALDTDESAVFRAIRHQFNTRKA